MPKEIRAMGQGGITLTHTLGCLLPKLVFVLLRCTSRHPPWTYSQGGYRDLADSATVEARVKLGLWKGPKIALVGQNLANMVGRSFNLEPELGGVI